MNKNIFEGLRVVLLARGVISAGTARKMILDFSEEQ